MSAVNLSRCLEDMRGKGAELSSPRIDRMSWRMWSTPSGWLFGADCSLSRAGMLF